MLHLPLDKLRYLAVVYISVLFYNQKDANILPLTDKQLLKNSFQKTASASQKQNPCSWSLHREVSVHVPLTLQVRIQENSHTTSAWMCALKLFFFQTKTQ